ncbi:MAG: hypothetical protein HY360_07140 [Verrucomicrobia bacterium]|nr:hypothetical protein [Verrucomicrobiota bacterium]
MMTTEIIFGHGWSWGHLAVAAALAGVLLWQVYRWMLAPIPWKRRAPLLALRATWSFLLLWCIWDPVLQTVTRTEQSIPPRVMVMVDVSASMGLAGEQGVDRWQGLKEITRQLHAVLEKTQVKQADWLAFGSQLRPWQENLAPKDDQSLVLRHLREAAEKQTDPSTATALFLLTDGEDTTETHAADAISVLRAHSVRVFPIVPDGTVQPPPLARIERVLAPQQVSLNQSFEIQADLRLRCATASDFVAALERDGKELARQTIRHGGDGTARAEFPVKAEAIGLSLYTIRLLDGARKTELSHLSAPVRAKNRDALRVLYVQGGVDWEYRFLRQAVSENPTILLEGITQLNNQSFLRQAARGAAPDQLDHTPLATVRAAAQNSDVLVLANLNPEFLDAETQKTLLEMVRKRGGGILFFSGNSTQAARFRGTLLEELLPVAIGETSGPPLSAPCAMQITADGLASEIWRDAANVNAPLSQPPPTFLNFVRVQGVKPGATVLGVHPQEKTGGQPMPLLTSQNIGAGRSAFLGVDALWRWRMAAPAQARDYDRFWQQLLLWLGGRIQGVAIEMDRVRYPPGDTAHIKIRAVKSETPPRLFVRDSGGRESEAALSWNGGATEGKADYRFAGPGEFVFTVRNPAEILAQQVVDVRAIDLELEHAGLNEALLQQLARESGGQYLTSRDGDLIPSFLKSRQELNTRRERKPLWHSPWIFAVMLAAYGTELLLRHKYQLT